MSPPTAHLKYSNTAYSMLGLVIQAVSGMPYEAFVLQRIPRSLNMEDTMFHPGPEHAGRLADGHIVPPYERRFERTPQQDLRAYTPCGMLVSTPTDVLEIARIQWTENDLAPEATRREMHRVHLMDPDLPGWQSGYGLGWRLTRAGDRVIAGHSDSIPGSGTRDGQGAPGVLHHDPAHVCLGQ
ncbi:MAG: beta-lactamase family protein, partial [Armatimonadetes bacterium]|nr:beta-lactamase family protein [Armatimonadota bacterium]